MHPHFKQLALALVFIACIDSIAQTVHLLVPPRIQFLDQSGRPLAGGLVWTYTSGTTSLLATYNDYTGASANTNPVVLDSGGFANIWITDGSSYKICVQNSAGVQSYCIDGVSNPSGGSSSFNASSPPPIGNVLPSTIDGTTITAHTNFIGNITGNVTGNVGGNLTGNVTGNVTGNLSGSVTGGTVSGTTITASTGFSGPLTGNVTGNVTGNLTGNVTGNASTATSATSATTANSANNAAALTGFIHFRTSATCSTSTVAGNECSGTFSVPYTYTNSATWDVVCNGIGQTGYPFLIAVSPASGTTFNYVITNGQSSQAVVSGWSALACLAYGN